MAEPAVGLTVVELRVTLLDVHPQVWRELRVPGSVSLAALHLVLQVVLGWEQRHLHQWVINDVIYANPEEESWGEAYDDETAVTLATVVGPGESFRYDYDLGDGWEHLVEVMAISPYLATEPPLVCLAGAGACPPEDSGGPAGYEHLLDALADPADEEHDDVVAWLGDSFEPWAFDLARVNRALAAHFGPDR